MKRGFLTQNNLGTHHPFALKSGQNAEICYKITYFQGVSKVHSDIAIWTSKFN